MIKHNKKRNVGLLSEFFARYIAKAVVEFRYDDVDKAKSLWQRHVANSKQLKEELRLFDAVQGGGFKNKSVAHEMLKEVKKVCREQDQKMLDSEKTKLLHEINNTLGDPEFFKRPVGDYKENATLQILMNCWRSGGTSPNFSEVHRLEDQVLDHMVSEKGEQKNLEEAVLGTTKEDIDRLVVETYRKKLNERYSKVLTEDQKDLLGLYVFSAKDVLSKKRLTERLAKLRDETLNKIEAELKEGNGKTPKEKLEEVKECLSDKHYDVENISDDTLSFYLAVSNLKHELETAK